MPADAAGKGTGTLRLERYVVEERIGSGQFSTVYRGKPKAGTCGNVVAVALKKVYVYHSMDERTRRDCEGEINLLKQLNHPNIIKCIESFIEGMDLWIVLELGARGDLGEVIKQCKDNTVLMGEAQVMHYFVQLCDAIEHMHSRRVMHRDIKPANVFLTEKGHVKLGDFGLGRFVSTTTFAVHSMVGTPYYMAPERIDEQSYSFKSDMWSLGCLLYELVSLQSPFSSSHTNFYNLCKKIEKADYPPVPSDLYSDQLQDLISLCIQTNPDERPSAAQVLERAVRLSQSLH